MAVTGPGAPELRVLAETRSTNDDVRALAQEGARHGTAVAARRQLGGRGRRGHAWRSPEGGLYLSVLVRPGVGMRHFPGLPAACSLGAAEALEALGASGVGIKWPNDLVLGDGKLAGLLVEGGYAPAGDGGDGTYAVVGVGVNLRRVAALDDARGEPGADSPAALPVSCLEDALGGAVLPPFEEVARAVRDGVLARADAWADDVRAGRAAAGPLAPVMGEYFDRMPMMGRPVRAVLPDGQTFATGTLAGVDAWGRAVLVTDEGRELQLASEQASLRPR